VYRVKKLRTATSVQQWAVELLWSGLTDRRQGPLASSSDHNNELAGCSWLSGRLFASLVLHTITFWRFFSSWDGLELSSLVLMPFKGLLYPPLLMRDDECGDIGVMLGKGNRSIRRKPAPLQLCPPQIPHYFTGAAALGIRRLMAWAATRSWRILCLPNVVKEGDSDILNKRYSCPELYWSKLDVVRRIMF
jgi:hypothetical protein